MEGPPGRSLHRLSRVAAAGEGGVTHALTLLDADVRRTMALLGGPTVADLTRDLIG